MERAFWCSSRRLATVAMLNLLLASPAGSDLAVCSLLFYLDGLVVVMSVICGSDLQYCPLGGELK